MTRDAMIHVSDRWFRLLQRLYPVDFRDEMGEAMVETWRDRAREALTRGGPFRLAAIWFAALVDSLRNGPGERARPAVSWRRRGNWGRDSELAMRRLMRAPLFVLATAGTLTIGLGMVAVVYTVVQKVLIAPMPYRDADDLYYVWRDYGPINDVRRGAVLGPDLVEVLKADAVVEDAVALQRFLGGVFAPREGADPSEVSVMITSPQLFEMLGVTPMLGRTFARTEVGPNRPNLIVLSYDLWNRIGADPTLVGKDVRLQSRPFTVIGVLPPDFTFVRNDALGAAPQRADAYTTNTVLLPDPSPHGNSYSGLIRARRGTSPEAVEAAVREAGKVIDQREFNGRGLSLYAVGLKADLVARARPALLVLAAAGVVLALMLMVNLASVLLARAAQREHEYAVTRALGASGAAVVRATLIEGGLLGLFGGAGGSLLAIWGTRTLVALAPLDLPRRDDIALDWGVAIVVMVLGVVLGLLAASAPATWAARSALPSLLAGSAVRGGGGHSRLRRGMIVVQVALSLVLLSSGGLVVRSFERLLRVDPGFSGEGVLTMRIRTPPEFFPTVVDAVNFHDRLERAMTAIPGVTGASATSTLPLTANTQQVRVAMPTASGNSGDREKDTPLVDVIGTRGTYARLMGMRVLAGRAFEPTFRRGAPEVLIDRFLADRYFPKGDAIGAPLTLSNSPNALTIVGVVEPARLYDLHEDGRPQVYLRTEDWGFRPLSWIVRTERDPATIVSDVRNAVRRVDARVAVGEVQTMAEIVEDKLRQQRTSAVLVTTVALGALMLAAMGLFGVVSGSVTRRRHELAVRLALGAEHGNVLRLVLAEGALLVVFGVVISLPVLYAAGGVIRGILIGVSPLDPLTLVTVSLGLGLVTMIACYMPARRVLGIDPAQALRQ